MGDSSFEKFVIQILVAGVDEYTPGQFSFHWHEGNFHFGPEYFTINKRK